MTAENILDINEVPVKRIGRKPIAPINEFAATLSALVRLDPRFVQQTDFAKELGLPKQEISQFMSGRILPGLDNFGRLLQVLNIDPSLQEDDPREKLRIKLVESWYELDEKKRLGRKRKVSLDQLTFVGRWSIQVAAHRRMSQAEFWGKFGLSESIGRKYGKRGFPKSTLEKIAKNAPEVLALTDDERRELMLRIEEDANSRKTESTGLPKVQ